MHDSAATAADQAAQSARWRRLAWALLPAAIVAVLPLLPFVNNFILSATVRALVFIALGQSWNIVAGIGGQLSLGHGVFLGLGAYTAGILFNSFGLSPWLGAWAGAVISLLLAMAMGAMTLRMRGIFFALGTIAVSLAFDQLSRHFVDLTGGDNGLALNFVGDSWAAAQSRTAGPFIYAGLAFVIIYFWITRRILASQFGLELRAVRDDETAAAATGVRVFRTKMLGFLVSAVMTSLAGTLYVQNYQGIDPESAFGLSQAIQLQLPALIGGIGTAWGPVIGGAVMILLSESTNWGLEVVSGFAAKFGINSLNITGGDILVYGLLLLVVVLKAPKGIVGLLPKLRRGESHE